MAPGKFIWHELMTTDPEAAIGFYQKTIGWGVMPWQQDPSYRMFMWNGVPMAGLMLLPDDALQRGAPPHWIGYVSVGDVDATVMRADVLGAKTYLEPMDVPTVGRVAVLADPQGAVFGVYRADEPGPDNDQLAIGDFSWHDLVAEDWKSAWEFYRAIFGWEYDSQFDMGAAGIYWMFRRAGGSRALGGMFNRPPEIPVPSWIPYVHVKSADRAAESALQHGGRVVYGPREVPGGDRIAQIVDPQGGAFAVHAAAVQPAVKPQPTAPPAAPAKKPAAKKPAAAKPKAKAPARQAAAAKAVKPKGRPVKKAAKKTVTKKAVKKTAQPKGRPVKKAARRK